MTFREFTERLLPLTVIAEAAALDTGHSTASLPLVHTASGVVPVGDMDQYASDVLQFWVPPWMPAPVEVSQYWLTPLAPTARSSNKPRLNHTFLFMPYSS